MLLILHCVRPKVNGIHLRQPLYEILFDFGILRVTREVVSLIRVFSHAGEFFSAVAIVDVVVSLRADRVIRSVPPG